jgi:hypothetical protein
MVDELGEEAGYALMITGRSANDKQEEDLYIEELH